MKSIVRCIVFLLSLIAALPAMGQRKTLAVNTDVSVVKMTLKTNHDIVNGVFSVQTGSISFDAHDSKMSGSVVVAAGSAKTGNDTRDKKMNNDVLRVQEFSTVAFEPKSYAGTLASSGDSKIQVTGTFTLLGRAHDITLPMDIHIEGSSCVAKAHFIVPYVQWGLKDPSVLIFRAEKQVDIDLMLNGRLTPAS